jgi:hypothetical protein
MTELVEVAVLLVAVAAHTAVHVPILSNPMRPLPSIQPHAADE